MFKKTIITASLLLSTLSVQADGTKSRLNKISEEINKLRETNTQQLTSINTYLKQAEVSNAALAAANKRIAELEAEIAHLKQQPVKETTTVKENDIKIEELKEISKAKEHSMGLLEGLATTATAFTKALDYLNSISNNLNEHGVRSANTVGNLERLEKKISEFVDDAEDKLNIVKKTTP